MTDTHHNFQNAFSELFEVSSQDKIIFLEMLLYSFTVSARVIWSDQANTDADKVEAFKWLNELTHRIWKIRSDIKEGADSDSIKGLYENMKYYGGQSALLNSHLIPAFLSAFDRFKNSKGSA